MLDIKRTSRQDLDILSYRPSEPPKREIETDALVTGTYESQEGQTLTTCFEDFYAFMPCKVVSYVEAQQQDVNNCLNVLRQELQGLSVDGINFAELDQALSSVVLPTTAREILEKYYYPQRDDVTGSFELDLFYTFTKIARELERLRLVLLYINYGITDGVLPDDLMEAELEMGERLKTYELKGELEEINYPALAIDALIGRAAYKIANLLSGFVLELYADAALELDTPATYGDLDLLGIEQMFADMNRSSVKDDAKLDRYFSQDTMTKLFKEARAGRDRTLAAYLNEESLAEAAQNDTFIGRLLMKHRRQGFDTAMELVKYTNSLSYYLGDLRHTLKEKQLFRQVYSANL